jgi:hypothetical protein
VRRALVYVHANYRKHEPKLGVGVDPYSSGIWFSGWREARPLPLALSISKWKVDFARPPVAGARSWLLQRGWLQAGLISVSDAPSAARNKN